MLRARPAERRWRIRRRALEDESALQQTLAFVRDRTGHDFTHYKRATVLRRIARRMQVNSLDSIPAYLDYLAQSCR